MNRLVLAAALTLCAPVAVASGSVQIEGVKVSLDNGHTSSCIESITGLCLASSDGDTPGDGRVDTTQRLQSVRIELDGERWNERLGHALLPDKELVVNKSVFVLRNPVFPLAREHIGERRAPAPLDGFAVIFNEEGFGADYVGPHPGKLQEGVGQQHFFPRYQSDSVSEDRITLFNDSYAGSSDARVANALEWPCIIDVGLDCGNTTSALSTDYQEVGPDVEDGFSFEEASIATREGSGERSDPLGQRTRPVAIGARPAVGAPQRELPAPATMRPLPISDGIFVAPPDRTPDQLASGSPIAPTPPPVGPKTAEARPFPPAAVAITLTAGACLLIAAALYTRIHSRSEALQHTARQRILALLEARGPQTVAALARELGVDRTSIEHHTDVLRRTTQLLVQKHGKFSYLLLPGQTVVHAPTGSSATQEALLRIVLDAGGAMDRERLNLRTASVPPRTRNHALVELVRRGALRVDWDGYVETVRAAKPEVGGPGGHVSA